jgi:5'(3')-deoxyribonucleotidase
LLRRPRIGLDVDGPLTDGFWDAACRVLRDLGIAHARTEKIDRWDIMQAFGVPPEIAAEAYGRLREAGLALNFKPNAGAIEFVRELQEWADVYAVTSPLGGAHWAHEREVWLRDVMGIPFDRTISVRDKTVIALDALVDDKLATIEAWSKAYPAGVAVLWRAMHNAKEPWAGPAAWNYDELRAWLGALNRRAA